MVLVDLSCLLKDDAPRKIKGWFPLYDTLNGIRGRIRLSIKVQFFGDVNPFKDSAAGVHIFHSSSPQGLRVDHSLGFVEELLVADDPE
jgi:hypothetical protein